MVHPSGHGGKAGGKDAQALSGERRGGAPIRVRAAWRCEAAPPRGGLPPARPLAIPPPTTRPAGWPLCPGCAMRRCPGTRPAVSPSAPPRRPLSMQPLAGPAARNPDTLSRPSLALCAVPPCSPGALPSYPSWNAQTLCPRSGSPARRSAACTRRSAVAPSALLAGGRVCSAQ